MARRASEPVTVASQRLAEEIRRAGSPDGTRRPPKRLPYLSDLLRFRPQGGQYGEAETPQAGGGIISPANDRWETLKKDAIFHSMLLKTSFNHDSDKPHGQSNRRWFRLTEEAIEYYHVFFGQVRTDSRSFPLTSIVSIQREVSGNPEAFRLIYKKFIMELEASSVVEADSWVDTITKQWKEWKETGTLRRNDTGVESDVEESCPLVKPPTSKIPPFIGALGGSGNASQREITTIPEERALNTPSPSPSEPKKKRDRRIRSFSAGTTRMLAAQSSEDKGMDHKCRKTIRRRLRLAPKLEKQSGIRKPTQEEEMDHKKLHSDYAMIKYPRRHWWAIPSEKIFKIDRDNLQIMWRRHFGSNLSLRSHLSLDSILEVRLGQETSGFDKFPYDEMDKQSFSLIYEGMQGKYAHLESLDLICDHKEHYDEWIKGLDTLQIGPMTNMFPRRYENTDPILLWLKRYWICKHIDHELTERAAIKVARRFDPTLSEERCKEYVHQAHLNQTEPTMLRGNALRWDGFVLLYNILLTETGRLHEIFRDYAVTHKRLGMTLEEFQKFLIDECHWAPEQCSRRKVKELISFHDFHHQGFKKFTSDGKPEKWKKTSPLLSYAGFLSFLRSKHNAAVNPLHNVVYQDMTHPLSHYFINSSHNTYLEADQIYGKSTLDAYARALLHGCRCIEIDCWNNSVGKEPIVYHGYTFTTKLPLRDILHIIKHYAFQMSHYPLIISIENHCNSEQQATMARMFVEELVDGHQSMLPDENPDENLAQNSLFWRRRLPSPQELQGKILLKGSFKPPPEQQGRLRKGVSKAHSRALMALPDVDDPFGSGGDKAPNTDGSNSRDRVSLVRLRGSTRQDAQRFKQQVESGEVNTFDEDDQEVSFTETAPDLDKLIIYCRSTRLRPWDWDKQRQTTICQMFSFGENTAENLCKKNSPEMLACTERQLVRTYPKGSRIDSSNYSPMLHWNHGIHMVALNYQYPDIYMHLNQGKFRQNGGCGYVLKPKVMRTTYSQNPEKRFDPNMTEPHPDVPTCKLEISLLSGHNLSPPGKTGVYITVTIATHGIPADCACLEPKPEASSPFWPQWPKDVYTFNRQILMPELCLVYFRVDMVQQTLGSSQLMGQNCIPLSSLQSGIKFIQLRKAGGALIPESGLFVKIKKAEKPAQAPPSSQEPRLHKQDGLDESLRGIDPTQAIVPSQLAQVADHRRPSDQDGSRRARPKLHRQDDSVNPFDFSAAVAAAASIDRDNGSLKPGNSFQMSEMKFEADVTVHKDSSPVSSSVAQDQAAPGVNGRVNLVVIPTHRNANNDEAVANKSSHDAAEPVDQLELSVKSTSPLVLKEES